MPGPKISIIIPALNEAERIVAAIASARGPASVEVIVADGGSHDATVALAREAGARVLLAPPGRAAQMNAGADDARGEILIFLHADTRLPEGFEREAARVLAQPGVVAGAFRFALDAQGWPLRLIEWMTNARARWRGRPYGDQAIFVRRADFLHLEGYAALPIMEDFELVRRLQTCGRVRLARTAAVTSARRWQRLGVWRTTWINQKILRGWQRGVAAETLAAWYRDAAE